MGEQKMGKLLVYLKDYKKESVLGPLFTKSPFIFKENSCNPK